MSAMLNYVASLTGKMSSLDIQDKIARSDTWTRAGMVAAGTYLTYHGVDYIYTQYKKISNDKKRHAKTLENEKAIRELKERVNKNPLSEEEVERIIKLPVAELAEKLKSGHFRPINVLRAYQTMALRAHEKTNCLVEPIKEAEERALELEKGPREGLLWGVPMSIKDDVAIEGYDSCVGMVAHMGDPMKNTSTLLKVWMQHGAVPFVKTNVPQTEFSLEPGNPVNGTVRNPHDRTRGPGGSSSGEAALIASDGSLLGVGSDIAGSIRVPAHFCGIQGFKPTTDRMSYQNMVFDSGMMINAYVATWGPLSRDVEGLVLMMRALWEDCLLNETESGAPWQPFDNEEYNSGRKLRIGYFTENPLFPTFSACKRAVRETAELLTQQGHQVVPWQPPRMEETLKFGFGFLKLDGGMLTQLVKYDRVDSTVVNYLKGNPIPSIIRRILEPLIRPLCPGVADRLRVGPADFLTYAALGYELELFRREVYNSWKEAKLDAVICPPNIMVAPPLGNADLLRDTWIYTTFYNILHYPAGIVHITNVTDNDVKHLNTDYPDVSDRIHREAKAAMTGSTGLPVGVMVATPRYRHETCLRVMKIIEDAKKL